MAWKHPELKKGEVFLTNATAKDFRDIGWQTKRVGSTAYDTSNKPISQVNGLSPVFVQKSELEKAGVSV